jgi:RNA polymerase sigma-70 factor (ECF subfamily)
MSGDKEIAWRIRRGDKKAFESLFRSSYATLVKYAKGIIKDHDEAEETVQELFFRLWHEREKLNIGSSLNGYLFRAVHNRCLHYIEHRKVIEKFTGSQAIKDQELVETPAEVYQYIELQETIAGVLERLPERCGKIFCMNRFDGLKYAEIALKLDISVKTVEADMGKALKEFRQKLSERK